LSKRAWGQNYWFSLETYVHIALKRDMLLLYNSLTGKILEYQRENNEPVFHLVKKLRSAKNLLVVRLSGKDLEEPCLARFIHETQDYYMGELIDCAYSTGKPVQMMPVVSVKKGVKTLGNNSMRSLGEGVMKYLTRVSIYINNACGQGCSICRAAYKQFPSCTTAGRPGSELDLALIRKLFAELTGTYLVQLNILGGNIFRYSRFEELLSIIGEHPAHKTFYSHYLNLVSQEGHTYLNRLTGRLSNLKIGITFPLDEPRMRDALVAIEKAGLRSQFVFSFKNEAEFERAEAVANQYGLTNLDFQPLFDGNNLQFFENHVFSSRQEILEVRPQLNDILANQTLNRIDFGGLTLFNDGTVFANLNATRLGRLDNDSLYDILCKEMVKGRSWLKTRRKVEPCKNCTFQALCPPLNNYSYAIGRNDLCYKFTR